MVWDYLKREWNVQIQHSYRETNFCADWFAKKESRDTSSLTVWHSPPTKLTPMLLALVLGTQIVRPCFFSFVSFCNQKKMYDLYCVDNMNHLDRTDTRINRSIVKQSISKKLNSHFIHWKCNSLLKNIFLIL